VSVTLTSDSFAANVLLSSLVTQHTIMSINDVQLDGLTARSLFYLPRPSLITPIHPLESMESQKYKSVDRFKICQRRLRCLALRCVTKLCAVSICLEKLLKLLLNNKYSMAKMDLVGNFRLKLFF